jgi:ATP-dependent Clp protease protease subunit
MTHRMSTYSIPYVVQQTPRGERTLDLYSRLLSERIIYLGTEIDDGVANAVIAQMLHLSSENPEVPMSLYVNSPGGSITAMLAIHDVMRLIPNDVSTLAMGMAASAGQFLLSAGTPGKRYVLPHARVLLHQGTAGIGGTAVDIEIQADDLRQTRDTVLGLIAEHTGQDRESVERDSRRDRWFTADQALAYGFVDHVISSVADVTPRQRRSAGLVRAQ